MFNKILNFLKLKNFPRLCCFENPEILKVFLEVTKNAAKISFQITSIQSYLNLKLDYPEFKRHRNIKIELVLKQSNYVLNSQ